MSCYSKLTCVKCGRKHNTLLHYYVKNNNNDSTAFTSTSQQTSVRNPVNDVGEGESSAVSSNHVSLENNTLVSGLYTQSKSTGSTILAMALINVQANNGKINRFRVLFDQGSECCFVSEKAVNILKPQYEHINALIYGVGGQSVGLAKKLAHFRFLPREKGCKALSIAALVLYQPTSYHPPIMSENLCKSELKNLSLADPDLFTDVPIDFIICADKFGSCLLPGLKQNVF